MRDFWKYLPYRLKPTIFSIGSFEIRWYGVMYIVAFFLVYILAIYRVRKEKLSYNKNIISDFIFWSILGVIIGGRLGYVL
ncbi:MAG: prolipoprotein diacylglyceryl transferase, partial [Candidatus Aenigmatarchaeota archaeon]